MRSRDTTYPVHAPCPRVNFFNDIYLIRPARPAEETATIRPQLAARKSEMSSTSSMDHAPRPQAVCLRGQ